MKETPLTRKILLATSAQTPAKLFRNNVGQGWVGKHTRLDDGSVLIANPRPLHAGLHNGSGDLIGWTPVTVTPDMVGQTLAVFTSLEVKTTRRNSRPNADQKHWRDTVRAAGGIADIVRGPDDAVSALTAAPLFGHDTQE